MSASQSMHPNRKALIEEAGRLGIKGRHKMSAGTLRAAIEKAKPTQNANTIKADVLNPSTLEISGITAILEARRSVRRDTFAYGTVVRWEADAGYNVFLYAAIKTPVGWATTARTGNGFVPQVVDFDELLEILSRSEVRNVAVSSTWQTIG